MPDSDFTYVDPGFVTDGFAGEAEIAEAVLIAGQHSTDFREYRRGRLPGDWTRQWEMPEGVMIVEGAAVDMAHRNCLQITPTANSTNAALSWNAPEGDTGYADQETLTLQRVRTRTSASETTHRALLRASGTSSASATGYIGTVQINSAAVVQIYKFSGATFTLLASSAGTKAYPDGSWVWMRARANGTTLSFKAWGYGEAEPGSWDVTVTDATYATGWCGVMARMSGHVTDVAYYAVATNGQTALGVIEEPLDIWLMEPDEDIEITARVEYFNPTLGVVESAWYTNWEGRETDYTDWPSSAIMLPLLKPSGRSTERLEGDAHFGGVITPQRDGLRFENTPSAPDADGPLDAWEGYSFHGRPVEVRVGKRWLVRPSPLYPDGVRMPHRRFEALMSGVVTREPEMSAQEVMLAYGPPPLTQTVPVERNLGIATGARALTGSGWMSIPNHTAYDVSSFTLALRIRVPLVGIAGSGFSTPIKRELDPTHRQFLIALYQASHASAHKLQLIVSDTSGGTLVNVTPATRVNTNRFTSIILGVNGGDRWYCYIGGVRVGGGPLLASGYVATGQLIAAIADSSIGVAVTDIRLDKWVTESEALTRYATRKDPDALTLGMWRCDDATGSTVTDYSALANHGTLQGTNAVDREWVATYLGGPEVAGLPMPFTGGAIYNIATQTIDTVRNAHRYNDRARTTGTGLTVRVRGLAVGTYAEPAEAPGVIDMTAGSDQPVTAGLASNTAPESVETHIPRLVKTELVTRGAITADSADLASFDALRNLLPYKGGFSYPDPPRLGDFLTSQLGPIGGYHGLDRDGRIMASALTPPANPGPYGQDTLLEFVGYPDRGVTLAAHSSYSLTQAASWSLTCWFKLHRSPVDASTSSTFAYFPTGMTLIDRVQNATGYYMGIDGRDGFLIFGAPTVVGTTTGFHYLKLSTMMLRPGVWYCAHGVGAVSLRSLKVFEMAPTGAISRSVTEATVGLGLLVDAPKAPVRIGHGPRGSFAGSIAYAVGSSGALSGATFNTWPTTRPVYGDDPDPDRVDRWFLEMREGLGDTVLEQVQGRQALIDGVRWAPRMSIDLRTLATTTSPGRRRLIPAWQVRARYRPNTAPLTGANVAPGVAETDRAALAQFYLEEPSADLYTRDSYLDSREVTVQTGIYSAADAARAARGLKDRISREQAVSTVERAPRGAMRLALTDEVVIMRERFGPEEGEPMRLVNAAHNLDALESDIGLWGRGPDQGEPEV